MKMTFLELRRNPSKLLEALERNEEVTISRRGREIARILPAGKTGSDEAVNTHPAFGMWGEKEEVGDPSAYVRQLRKGRYSDL
ncbi:MAG: type II toxin-antitoxin system prevent-host-death family antitoxin [Candidatus Sumerlaeia bacterium]|nr:type II toxin-antitoxin system prevent-host-death family antitoxin [Candidatus Sumerlaeia bacterium]